MASNIIELIDGKYRFNKNNLLSSLRKVRENDCFAVIPVIGKNTEFLNKYLNKRQISDENHEWLVRISCKDIVLKTSYQKTSVLLLESRLPLQFSEAIENKRVVRHIYGLFLKFSSTLLIIFDKSIKNEEILFLQQILESNDQNINKSKPFNELFIVVTDWDPKAPGPHKNYLFGSKGGANYLKNEFKDSKLKDYFRRMSCFLLPPINTQDYPTNEKSLLELHLLNIDEMEIMKDPRTNDNLKVNEFVESIESYVESLNQTLLGEHGLSIDSLTMKCQSVQPSETLLDSEISSDLSEELKESERIDPGFRLDEFETDELYEIIEQGEISEIKKEMESKVILPAKLDDKAIREKGQFNLRSEVMKIPSTSTELYDSVLIKKHQDQISVRLSYNEKVNKSSDFLVKVDQGKSSVELKDNITAGIQEKVQNDQNQEYSLIEKSKINKFEMMDPYQDQSSTSLKRDEQGVSRVELKEKGIENIQEKAQIKQRTNYSMKEKPKNTEFEMLEFCHEQIKSYEDISEELIKNNDLVIMSKKSAEILGNFNAKFMDIMNTNISDFNQTKEELRKMIKQKENEIKDKIEKMKNTKNSIETTIKLYNNQFETELKQHFQHLNNDFTPINFDSIDKSSELYAYSTPGQILSIADQLMLNERLEAERKMYKDIVEPLNQYMKQWKSHIENNVQDELMNLEQLNERLVKLYFTGLNYSNNPVINNLIKLATNHIFAKIKHNYQQKPVQMKQIRQQTMINLEDHKPGLIKQGTRSATLEKIAEIVNHYEEEVEKMIEANLLENLTWNSFKAMDVQVSNNCTWMFNAKGKTNDSDLEHLKDELEKKKQDYLKAIQVIIKYRDEWMKEFQNNIFIESRSIYGLNQDKITRLIIPENMSKFIRKQLKIIFGAVIQENEAIIKSENGIAKEMANKLAERFSIWINFKLKSGFYNKDKFDCFYEELVKHSMNSLNKNFDYKSNQNSFLIQYENEMEKKLLSQKSIISSDYLQNTTETKKSMKLFRDNAKGFIQKGLDEKYPDHSYEDKREFEKFSEQLKTQTIDSNKENMEKIKANINEDFYQYLIDENIKFILDEFQKSIQFYFLKERQVYPGTSVPAIQPINSSNQPKPSTKDQFLQPKSVCSSTISILFGKLHLFSNCIKHNSNEKDYFAREETLTRPNCIRIGDQVLIGQDAKDIAIYESFDIKNLLFIRDMDSKEDQKKLLKEYPFEFTMDHKVKYYAINSELSIESLIALQILDIKSETEKRVNTNVTNAVFIVPTNYTIRQFEDFKNIGKLSAFEENKVNIVTQINCAVIGFAEKMRLQGKCFFQNVLIISLNEYECDSAVCQINDYNIKYKSFLNKSLNSNKGKRFWQILFKNDQDQKTKMMTNFKSLIEETFRLSKTYPTILDYVIVSGTSLIYFEIKKHIMETYKFKIKCNYDPVDIILEGATYFARSYFLNDTNKFYKIQELIKHDIKCRLAIPHKLFVSDYNRILFSHNKGYGEHTLSNVIQNHNEFPFDIKIYQDDCLIGHYSIGNQVSAQFKYFNHYIKVSYINNEQKLIISSWIIDKSNNKHRVHLNISEIIKPEQSLLEIEKQTKIIKSIVEKF